MVLFMVLFASGAGVSVLVFLVLLAANAWVFFRRDWEESYYPCSYHSLYTPLDLPTVRRWKIDSGMRLRPEIVWNRTPEAWEVRAEGEPVATCPGDAPVLDLVPKKDPLELEFHEYVLRPLPAGSGPDLTFRIRPISRAFYESKGMSVPKDIFTISTEVPVGEFRRYPVRHWMDAFGYVPDADREEARLLLREEAGVATGDVTLERMAKVMVFLRKKLGKEARGIPKDSFRWSTPWEIYREMAEGTGKGYCTQFAQIFVFFANMAGIPTRLLSGANTQENRIYYTGHTWAECYVGEEGRWVHVDPTHSIIAVRDRKGGLVNSADILNLAAADAFGGFTARIFKDWEWEDLEGVPDGDGVLDVPFETVKQIPVQESPTQAILKYRVPPVVEDIRHRYGMLGKRWTFFWGNVLRYWFRPSPAYSLMPTAGRRIYLLRRGLLAALVVAGIWLLV